METLVFHRQNNEQLIALKALAKAWKIKFEINSHDTAFVAMVKNAEKRGNYKDVDPNDIWDSLNLK
jgi:hypothetical protein